MDPAIKKKVLRLFTYGLYAVTSKNGDETSAMTANSTCRNASYLTPRSTVGPDFRIAFHTTMRPHCFVFCMQNNVFSEWSRGDSNP